MRHHISMLLLLPLAISCTPVAESVRPTLRWQPFLESGQAVSDVRYDLRIMGLRGKELPYIAYERRGLPATEHQIERALAAGTVFAAVVRPRFLRDGIPRVGTWGRCMLKNSGSEPVYRFRTPDQ